jgi:hypothetical protein
MILVDSTTTAFVALVRLVEADASLFVGAGTADGFAPATFVLAVALVVAIARTFVGAMMFVLPTIKLVLAIPFVPDMATDPFVPLPGPFVDPLTLAAPTFVPFPGDTEFVA